MMNPQTQSHLVRLPVELRIAIYEKVLMPIKTRPLYVARNVWAWKEQPQGRRLPVRPRKFLDVLLICRRIHDEAASVLYRKHELCLITECTRDINSLFQVRRRVCPIEEYADILKRVRSIRLKLLVTGQLYQADLIIGLLSWIKAVLAERHTPLKRMTVEFGATSWEVEHMQTAVVHAAQGFRDLAPTQFEFQCGFQMGSERAMLALAEHANSKRRMPLQSTSEEEALKELLQAWDNVVSIDLSTMKAIRWCKTW